MPEVSDLKSRAGLLLYRDLPEEYRYRDTLPPGSAADELGDLEAYLHGFGHLLDLIRGTTEQAYADAFAEAADNGRRIQTWLLPYLAELVGAELLAPDPERRADELNHAVTWFKGKGTPRTIDSLSDTVAGTETMVVEGWRRVLATPRPTLPPFTAPAAARGDGDPLGPPALPLGTPDLRTSNRAIADPAGASPLYRVVTPQRDADGRRTDPAVTYWKPRARRGTPCFPGAYDDTALRTPDLRDPRRTPSVGPHPRRTLIHVRPPFGFFEPGLKTVALPAGANPLGFDLAETSTQTYGPAEILRALGEPWEDAPDRLVVGGNLAIPVGLRIAFHDVLFADAVTLDVDPNRPPFLSLTRCAAALLAPGPGTETPSVEAQDCLFGAVAEPAGFAQLVYCTVLGDTELARLWASDCLFAGRLSGLTHAEDAASCVRYSRVADLAALDSGDAGDPEADAPAPARHSRTNTTADPNFIRLYVQEAGGCVLRAAAFGEPGCGVLDLTTAEAISAGAEDEGEMGAYHHLYLSAQLRALRVKLTDFLPLGQEIAIRIDPRLAWPPATVDGAGSTGEISA